MGIKIMVRTSARLDVGDPDVDEWVCNLGHVVSPNAMARAAYWDFEDRKWYHGGPGVRCGSPMNMYKKA